MANKKITELTAIGTVASNDLLPIVDISGNETMKATVAQVITGLIVGVNTAKITVSASTPAGPATGDLWVDTA